MPPSDATPGYHNDLGKWDLEARRLDSAGGEELEDGIDFLTHGVLSGPPDPGAAPVLRQALARAQSDLARASAAMALAYAAGPLDADSVDALLSALRATLGHAYLGPAFLDALGLLALRSGLARTELSSQVLRLKPDDASGLLVRAAKWVGWLHTVQPSADLCSWLRDRQEAPDPFVRAEARQQVALIQFGDLLLAPDPAAFRERLVATRAAFARAHASEEHRPDAEVFVHLLDLVILFEEVPNDPGGAASHSRELRGRVTTLLTDISSPGWHGYRSSATDLLGVRLLAAADAFARAAEAASELERRTDLDRALLELATLYQLVASQPPPVGGTGRVLATLSDFAPRAMAPRLGAVVSRSLTRMQLQSVVERYADLHDDGIAAALQVLQAAAEAGLTGAQSRSPSFVTDIQSLASRSGRSAEDLLRGFIAANDRGDVGRWLQECALDVSPLPIHQPELFGGDPAVDDTVRQLLEEARSRLGAYPKRQWLRFVTLLESLVQFVQWVRNAPPAYTLCIQDGGLGQGASEGDLQKDVLRWLRQDPRIGARAVYERTLVAGGRTDSGAVFEECELPIEVKHEFSNIGPAHVRSHYLAQADDYAAARAGIAFLLVLDLRATNAAGHLKVVRGRRRTGEGPEPVSGYSLKEGFWIDGLPVDPQLPHAMPKVVVIGLIPGNRARPSSKTNYSDRPRR